MSETESSQQQVTTDSQRPGGEAAETEPMTGPDPADQPSTEGSLPPDSAEVVFYNDPRTIETKDSPGAVNED